MFVTTILFIVNRRVRNRRSSLSPFAAQFSLQMINLQLQSPNIFPMRNVTRISGLALTSVGGMHTHIMVLSSFKIDKVIFMLGPHRFYLV